MSQWPSHGSLLIPGVNNTWNQFQKFSKGKPATSLQWKLAKEKLRKEYEEYRSRGGMATQSQIPSRKGTTLTTQQVIEIYNLKAVGRKERLGSELARKHGVSPKAIRDIWKGRTWTDITSHLGRGDTFTSANQLNLKSAGSSVNTCNTHLLDTTFRTNVFLNIEFPPLVPADSLYRHRDAMLDSFPRANAYRCATASPPISAPHEDFQPVRCSDTTEADNMSTDPCSTSCAGEVSCWLHVLLLPASAGCCPPPTDPTAEMVVCEGGDPLAEFMHASNSALALEVDTEPASAACRPAPSPAASQLADRWAEDLLWDVDVGCGWRADCDSACEAAAVAVAAAGGASCWWE